MITKEEFLAAVDIVNRYKFQLLREQRELKEVLEDNNLKLQPLTRDTPLSESGLSARARNVLKNRGYELIDQEKMKFSYICLGDFEGVR